MSNQDKLDILLNQLLEYINNRNEITISLEEFCFSNNYSDEIKRKIEESEKFKAALDRLKQKKKYLLKAKMLNSAAGIEEELAKLEAETSGIIEVKIIGFDSNKNVTVRKDVDEMVQRKRIEKAQRLKK